MFEKAALGTLFATLLYVGPSGACREICIGVYNFLKCANKKYAPVSLGKAHA